MHGVDEILQLLYDDAPAKLKHTEEWEAVYAPLHQPFDADVGVHVDYDKRDFRRDAPEGAVYAIWTIDACSEFQVQNFQCPSLLSPKDRPRRYLDGARSISGARERCCPG